MPNVLSWIRRSRRLALIAATATGLLASTGIAAGIAAQNAGGESYTIRWAAQEVPEDFVYRGKNFAAPFGLTVQTETNPSAARSLQDLIAGRVDIVDTGSAPALSAMERDAGQLVIVAATHSGGQRHEVIVSPKSSYRSIDELRHHRVAIPVGSGAYIAWAEYLKKRGWSDGDFQIVNMQPPDMANALAQGQVDAVVVWEPTASILVTNGIGREIANFGQVTTDPGLLVTTRAFASAHPAALERFLASDERMYEFIRTDPRQAAQIAARVAGESGAKVNPDAFARAFRHMTFDMNVTSSDVTSLDDVAKYMVAAQKLQTVPDLSRMIDLSYLHAAAGIAKSAGR